MLLPPQIVPFQGASFQTTEVELVLLTFIGLWILRRHLPADNAMTAGQDVERGSDAPRFRLDGWILNSKMSSRRSRVSADREARRRRKGLAGRIPLGRRCRRSVA